LYNNLKANALQKLLFHPPKVPILEGETSNFSLRNRQFCTTLIKALQGESATAEPKNCKQQNLKNAKSKRISINISVFSWLVQY